MCYTDKFIASQHAQT